jgi:hypothetical protein
MADMTGGPVTGYLASDADIRESLAELTTAPATGEDIAIEVPTLVAVSVDAFIAYMRTRGWNVDDPGELSKGVAYHALQGGYNLRTANLMGAYAYWRRKAEINKGGKGHCDGASA